MKFNIQREALLKPLQLACGVIERRQTLPILSNILLDLDHQQLSITATDLEVEMIMNVAVTEQLEPGKVTVPARKLMDICRTLPDQASLDFSAQKERAVIRSGNSRFTLLTVSASDFPTVGPLRAALIFSLPQQILRKVIDSTQFAMAHQDVRYYLNGLLLELGNERLCTVATDGHRLAFCEVDAVLNLEEMHQVIIPRKGILEMSRLLADTDAPVEVQLGTNHIRITTPEINFTSKLIDGRFPDYQRVLPKGGDKVIVAERLLLRQAIMRASIVSNEKYHSVRLQLAPGILRLYAHNPEQEEVEEEIAVDYQGKELEIGFNLTYLLDVLSVIAEDKVQIILTDANSSCLIQTMPVNDCQYVIMPMRL